MACLYVLHACHALSSVNRFAPGAMPQLRAGHVPVENRPISRDDLSKYAVYASLIGVKDCANLEPRTKNEEPNLNTNREVRTWKFERYNSHQ